VAITDGATPSNEGRGYVLRRVLRRAVRFGRQMLGADTGFLTDLVPIVAKTLGDGFPELRANTARVAEIIADEEASFGKTLDKGLKVFWRHVGHELLTSFDKVIGAHSDATARRASLPIRNVAVADLEEALTAGQQPADSSTVIQLKYEFDLKKPELYTLALGNVTPQFVKAHYDAPLAITGDDAFMLYDTYGFPLDLTQMMAAERGLTVDVAGFERAMEQQRERSRAGSKFGSGDDRLRLEPDALARLAAMNIGPTDDAGKHADRAQRATVRAIFNGRNFDEHADAASSGLHRLGIVLDTTAFYAEAGGQVADTGRLQVLGEHRRDSGAHRQSEFKIDEVQRFGDYVLHIGRLVRGEIRVGEEVECRVDRKRRAAIAANHTATHLLNLALKQTLGDGIDQKGSLVDADKLRFDFSHGKPLTDDEVAAVERIVAERIEADLPVHAQPAPLAAAQAVTGVRAVFGETYPDPVRVVSIGAAVDGLLADPDNADWAGLSIEFCGGTHLPSTGAAGAFAVVQETGVAKGIRRIEAITADAAAEAAERATALNASIASAAKLNDAELVGAMKSLASEIDQQSLSLSAKAKLRRSLAGLQERAKGAAKAAAKEAAARAVQEARQLAESAKADLREVVIGRIEAGEDRGALQAALKVVADTCPSAAVLLASTSDDRVALIAQVPDALIKRGLKAGDWIKAAAEACGGKGGGKPNQAQGGGTEPGKLKQALEAAESFAWKAMA
ncbi:MAG: alanine--tRNA ligase-related protein, partial [Planctomycetota bacterium]